MFARFSTGLAQYTSHLCCTTDLLVQHGRQAAHELSHVHHHPAGGGLGRAAPSTSHSCERVLGCERNEDGSTGGHGDQDLRVCAMQAECAQSGTWGCRHAMMTGGHAHPSHLLVHVKPGICAQCPRAPRHQLQAQERVREGGSRSCSSSSRCESTARLLHREVGGRGSHGKTPKQGQWARTWLGGGGPRSRGITMCDLNSMREEKTEICGCEGVIRESRSGQG